VILLDILPNGRLIKEFKILNIAEPGRFTVTLNGEHDETIVHAH